MIVCTLALYFNSFPGFPLVVAANRDESYDRPSAPPSVIGTLPAILAGKDLRAGGTWLGVNEYGLLVGILNRRAPNSLPTRDEYRSRGLLCLELLRLKDVTDVERIFHTLSATAYQPFTIVGADSSNVCVACNIDEKIEMVKLQEGLHVFSNSAAFNAQSEKVSRVYEQFLKLSQTADERLSVSDYVGEIARVLGDHSLGQDSNDPRDAICVHGEISGTVSSSVIFYSDTAQQFQSYYCDGAPCRNPFIEYPSLDLR